MTTGLSPSSVLIVSMAAATRRKFIMTVGPGVLSSPSRAAASEKESSSSVKCSEIVMGCFGGPEFTVLRAPKSHPSNRCRHGNYLDLRLSRARCRQAALWCSSYPGCSNLQEPDRRYSKLED